MTAQEMLATEPKKYDSEVEGGITSEWKAWFAEYRKQRETEVGKTLYTTSEVESLFKIESFSWGAAEGIDRKTGERVLLNFDHSPRLYWKM